jgi:hypothetical protein
MREGQEYSFVTVFLGCELMVTKGFPSAAASE